MSSMHSLSQAVGHASCGHEPALPAFSTDAHPRKCVCAVSCFKEFSKFERKRERERERVCVREKE